MTKPLNGWQRMWVVLMLLWALVVGGMGYVARPTYLYHSDNLKDDEVVSRMATKTWDGDGCRKRYSIELSNGTKFIADSAEAGASKNYLGDDGKSLPLRDVKDVPALASILERMLRAGESEGNMKLVGAHFAGNQLVRASVPLEGLTTPVELCFAVGTSEADMTRMVKEYIAAYRGILRDRRMEHGSWAFAAWLVPGLFLYAFGWGVGWVRRGFSKEPTATSGGPPAA
jgi:hypothetical protein